MSPIRRKDFTDDLELLPEAVDQWRASALQRVARCLTVQANSVLLDGVVGVAMGDPAAVDNANVNLDVLDTGTRRVLGQAYGIEAHRRLADDRTVFTGYATDDTDNVVPGAEVTIARSDTGEVLLRGTADANGHYIIDGERSTIEAVVAAGVGITESIAHERLDEPVRSVVSSDRIDTRITALDDARISARPGPIVRPSGPNRPSGPVQPTPISPAGPTSLETRALNEVSGIGVVRRARLAAAGIADLAGLSVADPERVAEKAGVSTDMAKEWITSAKRLLRSDGPG